MALTLGEADLTILFVVIGIAIVITVIVAIFISCYICRLKCPSGGRRTVFPPPYAISPFFAQPEDYPNSSVMTRVTSHGHRPYMSNSLPRQQRPAQMAHYVTHSLPRRQHQRVVQIQSRTTRRKQNVVRHKGQHIIKPNTRIAHNKMNGYVPKEIKNKKIQTNLSDYDSRSTSRQSSFTQTDISHQEAELNPTENHIYSEVDIQKKIKDKEKQQTSKRESYAQTEFMDINPVRESDLESNIHNNLGTESNRQNSIMGTES